MGDRSDQEASERPERSGSLARRDDPRTDELQPNETGRTLRGIRRVLFDGSWVVAALLAVPFLLFLWLFVAARGTVTVAEALRHTDGLAAVTYGSGFSLSAVIFFLGLLGSIAVRICYDSDELSAFTSWTRRPSLVLLVLVVVPALLVVPIESSGIDLPDVATTALLLGTTFYLWLMIPVVMVGLAWRLGSALYGWAASSRYRSGLITGTSATMALVVIAISSLFSIAPDSDDSQAESKTFELEDSFQRELSSAGADGPIDVSLAAMTDLSESSEVRSERTDTNQKLLDECFRQLWDSSDGTSVYRTAVRRIRRRDGIPNDIAEDLVTAAAISTCEKYANDGLETIEPYFYKTLKNEANDTLKENKGTPVGDDFPPVPDTCPLNFGSRFPTPGRDHHNELVHVRNHFCELSTSNRKALLMRASGYEYFEIAEEFDISEAAARKRVQRARSELEESLE